MMPEKNIRNQVNRICNNEEFSSKTLLCKFLRFVVDETLAGRGDQIKAYIIGIEVFGKDEHFDPEQDSLVRIHAGRLRRLLKMYYLEAGKKDPILIDIPKGSYQATIHERNQELGGRKPDGDPDLSESDRRTHQPTLAILPFKNLTGDPGKDFLAHGLSEEICIELARYEDLKVISCWYRPESDPENINDLYDRYRVNFLVDGSVQMSRKSIRIFVKLIDTFSREQIWGKKYKRNLSVENLIEIEEEISEEIAKTLGSELGIIFRYLTKKASSTKPGEIDVFNAMLHFYYFEAHMSPELIVKTFRILEEAIQKDPDSGKLNAMLSVLYSTAYTLDFPNSENAYVKMVDLSSRAMTLEPDNQLVRIIHLISLFFQDKKKYFLEETNNCLSMDLISPMRLGAIGFYLALFGEWEQGKAILDKAMKRNIGYLNYFHGATSLYHYRKDEFEKSLEEANKYNIPGLFWGPMLRTASLGQLKLEQEASEQIKHLKSLKPDFEEKAYYLISRFVKEDDLVEKVVDGLAKAGLKILRNSLVKENR